MQEISIQIEPTAVGKWLKQMMMFAGYAGLLSLLFLLFHALESQLKAFLKFVTGRGSGTGQSASDFSSPTES